MLNQYTLSHCTGVWNNDPADDFVKQDGMLLAATGADGNYTEADYFQFGESCEHTNFPSSEFINL